MDSRSASDPAPPEGYPRSYETELTLSDGRQVQVRPVLPSDAEELRQAILTADADTLRARFLGGPPPVNDELLRRLTCLDYVERFALVARAQDGHGVAIARYALLPDGPTAEVAVAVDPPWRRVGLATQLVRLLAQRALECGIDTFTASYLAQNRPVAELADETGARVVISHGAAELSARFADAPAALREPLV
jgi:GNAT superfamily N-acetyltransferase